jgi:hypothetical protein
LAIEHRNIPDNERHEPKGISTAIAGQVYRSNGAASGVWKDEIISLSGVIADVSTPSSILIPIPSNCVALRIKSILGGAITGSDPTITVSRGGDSAVLGTYPIPFTSSAEGTTVNTVLSVNNDLVMDTHNYIKIATDGASSTAIPLYISIKVRVTE